MSAQAPLAAVEEELVANSFAWNNPDEILNQLERVVSSVHFRNSKRYPALLRYLVEESLLGRAECLKERTLGIEVFGRPVDYDTNADPVVRITAGEVRKRIAQYYQVPAHDQELRLSSAWLIRPRFQPPHEARQGFEVQLTDHATGRTIAASASPLAIASSEQEPGNSAETELCPELLDGTEQSKPSSGRHTSSRLKWFHAIAAICLLGLVAICSVAVRNLLKVHRQNAGLNFFWGPFLHSQEPAMIVLGVHSFDIHGNDVSPISFAQLPPVEQTALSSMIRSNMVPVSDVVSYSELVSLLTRQSLAFRTQSAAETSIEEFRRGPIILIGGFDNMWTMRLTSSLRFKFFADNESLHGILDIVHPATRWLFDNAQSALSNSSDYAIVARFFDPQIEQHVLVVAGIGKSGTEAAAQFVTDKHALETWVDAMPTEKLENVEIVLATDVIEGKHGPAHVVASYRW